MIEHPRNSGIKIRERSNGSFLVDIPIKDWIKNLIGSTEEFLG